VVSGDARSLQAQQSVIHVLPNRFDAFRGAFAGGADREVLK
jgi:hypothetical protein